MCRTVIALTLLTLTFFYPSAEGKESWEDQQNRSESQTEKYLQRYPEIRSNQFVFKEIVLPDGNSLELDLRIERPKSDGPFPVVFFVHGGGWVSGCKSHFCHHSFELAKNGIAGVRIEYRWKSQGGVYSNVIGDVLDAIDFIRSRSKELNLDFSRVGIAGGSAGAHLSAIAAQRTPECICYDGFNGLYDVDNPGASRFAGGGDFTGSTQTNKQEASAIYQIKTPPPNTLLYHGTEDTVIDVEQCRRFAKAIQKQGGQVETLIYEGVGHSFFMKEPYLSQTTRALLDHIKYTFGLDAKKPILDSYVVEPKIASFMSGFSLIGQWKQEDSPNSLMQFNIDKTIVGTNKGAILWDERYGNYYYAGDWNKKVYEKIQVLEPMKIKLGKAIYMRAAVPTTVVPTTPLEINEEWLVNRHKELLSELDNREELSKVNLLFVGDSITQGWLREGKTFWDSSFSSRHWHALNLGVAGNRTENLLQRLQPISDGGMGSFDDPILKPRIIVLMIGTNNLLVNTPEEIVSGVMACKTRLQKFAPQSRMILCSVLPVANNRTNEEIIIPVNAALEKMHNPPEVWWHDLYSCLVNNQGQQIEHYFIDDVHLSHKGYQIWHDHLIDLIKQTPQLLKQLQ